MIGIDETGRVADEQPAVAGRGLACEDRPPTTTESASCIASARSAARPRCRSIQAAASSNSCRARGLVGLPADADRQMIAARKRPQISGRRLREGDVDLRGAQPVDVVAAGDRQRPARETAASSCGAPGCWRRRRRPAIARSSGAPSRSGSSSRHRAVDPDDAFGDELGPGARRRFEQGQIEVAAGSDEQRGGARAGGRQLDVDVGASVAELAAGRWRPRDRPRSAERPEEHRGRARSGRRRTASRADGCRRRSRRGHRRVARR